MIGDKGGVMIFYKNQNFKDFSELFKTFDLYGYSRILTMTGASYKRFNDVVKSLNIISEIAILKPSERIVKLYQKNDAEKIIEKLNVEYKNEEVPSEYIPKKNLITWLEVSESTFLNMHSYCSDLKKYSKYFFINNIKTKYYLFDERAKDFYLQKKYAFIDYEKRRKHLLEDSNYSTYTPGNLHKVLFDYEMLKKLFDTKSVDFYELMKIYKKYAKLQIKDRIDIHCHHIIPRFITDYKKLWDVDNTIYVPQEVHILIHLLEFCCALPQYKSKFFGAFAILSTRIDASKINKNTFNLLKKTLIKSLQV